MPAQRLLGPGRAGLIFGRSGVVQGMSAAEVSCTSLPHSIEAGMRLERLGKSYGALEAMKPLSLAMEGGTLVTLLEFPNCGNSTLLRTAAGLDLVNGRAFGQLGALTTWCKPWVDGDQREHGKQAV